MRETSAQGKNGGRPCRVVRPPPTDRRRSGGWERTEGGRRPRGWKGRENGKERRWEAERSEENAARGWTGGGWIGIGRSATTGLRTRLRESRRGYRWWRIAPPTGGVGGGDSSGSCGQSEGIVAMATGACVHRLARRLACRNTRVHTHTHTYTCIYVYTRSASRSPTRARGCTRVARRQDHPPLAYVRTYAFLPPSGRPTMPRRPRPMCGRVPPLTHFPLQLLRT